MKQFVHLHTHTGFSILDGMTKIPDLVMKVVEDGAPAVAVTDHGTMPNYVELVAECNKAGIKAIPGIEFYHSLDRFVKPKRGGGAKANNHLTALAISSQGYKNMMKVSSSAHIESKWGKWAMMDDEILNEYSDGLVITTGCLSSIVSQHLLKGEYDKALEQAAIHRDIVGREHYFVEIQRHGITDQEKILGKQLQLAKDLNVGLVATNDSHYTRAEDADGHEALLCVQTNDLLSNPDRFHFDGNHAHYVKTAKEMWELFPEREFSGACANTLLIAEMCDVQIDLNGEYLLPKFDTSEIVGRERIEVVAKKNDTSVATEYLRNIVEKRAKELYSTSSGEIPKSVTDRIDHELNIIHKMGFPDYFLILSDCTNWAREKGIAMGPARGCLLGDTQILTDSGYKNLSDVVIGDKVFTHKGRWQDVELTFSYELKNEKTYRVYSTLSESGIEMTADHKVLSLCDGKMYWTQASSLTPDHYVCIPKNTPGKIDVSHEDAYWLGSLFGGCKNISSDEKPDVVEKYIVDVINDDEEDFSYDLISVLWDDWTMESRRSFLKGFCKDSHNKSLNFADTMMKDMISQDNDFGMFEDKNYMYIPVADIIESDDVDRVYDIQVAVDHSFLTNEFVVHNSAAGSLISYLCGITAVDPLEYNLLFERFLNPHRKGMPDIDVDFDPTRQGEVVEYMINKYGRDKVSLISTYSYMKTKQSLKDAARVMGYPPAMGQKLSDLIPTKDMTGWSSTLAEYAREVCSEKIKGSEKAYAIWENGAKFRKEVANNKDFFDIVNMAKSMEGSIRQAGQHPSGVLLTPTPLWDHVPVRQRTKSKTKSDKSEVDVYVSEYDMESVSAIGGLKFDFLMIANLPIIMRALELIKSTTGKVVDLDSLPKDDDKVYDMLSRGISAGVFQLDSEAAIKMLKSIKPTGFHDLYNVLAINRPGPLASGMDQSYSKRKVGKEKKFLISPELDREMPPETKKELRKYMDDTYGLCVYQEQIMFISQVIAGFSTAEADNFRRVISKKDLKKMESMKDNFFEKGSEKGYNKSFMNNLWDILLPFSDYCFNKSHAVGYSVLSYQTAWLKAHYPAQFTAACLDFFKKDKIPSQIASARDMGVSVQPPNINRSTKWSTASQGNIWLGFSLIGGIGDAVVKKVVDIRESGGEFTSFDNFVKRTQGVLSESQIESLIKLGSLDNFSTNMRSLILILPDVFEAAKKDKVQSSKTFSADLGSLFGDVVSVSDSVTPIPNVSDFSEKEKNKFSQEILGFSLGEHPCHEIRKMGLPGGLVFPDELSSGNDGEYHKIVAVAEQSERKISKKGTPYWVFKLSAGSGETSSIIFDDVEIPEGEVVLVDAKVQEDTFADNGSVKFLVNSIELYDVVKVKEVEKAKPVKKASRPAKKKQLHIKGGVAKDDVVSGDDKELLDILDKEFKEDSVTLFPMSKEDLVKVVCFLNPFMNTNGILVYVSILGVVHEAPFRVSDVDWGGLADLGVELTFSS